LALACACTLPSKALASCSAALLALVSQGAPVSDMFALIGLAMLVYGAFTGLAVYLVRWEAH